MEDAHLIDLNKGPQGTTHIFGVFDGHGGREVADFVRAHFSELFLSSNSYKSGNIKQALKETFLLLDKKLTTIGGMKELTKYHKQFINEFGLEDDESEYYLNKKGYIENLAFNIGCTCNILVIYGNEFYFANAGDSRSIILRNGDAISMSIDHKPELPNESERIRKAGATLKDGRINGALNLSRSIGDFQFKTKKDTRPEDQAVTCNPDVLFENRNEKDDFIIIGCDGIWECISNEGISDFVYSKIHNSPSITLEHILEEMFDRNVAKSGDEEEGCDNMTCMIIQLKK